MSTILWGCPLSRNKSSSLWSSRCARLLLGVWLIGQNGSRLTTARGASRNLYKSGPPRPLGSTTVIFLGDLETQSANFLCQALKVLRSLTAYG